MTDHTTASFCAKVFKVLADAPVEATREEIASEIEALTEEYDFSAYDLDCDKVLNTLGIFQDYLREKAEDHAD